MRDCWTSTVQCRHRLHVALHFAIANQHAIRPMRGFSIAHTRAYPWEVTSSHRRHHIQIDIVRRRLYLSQECHKARIEGGKTLTIKYGVPG